MSIAHIASIPTDLTAEQFLATDQHSFGDAWRYELVAGEVVAHAAPSPRHAAILAGLMGALANRLKGRPNGCVPEAGSGAVPRRGQRNTARIPDALVRCGEHPRVTFEIISPSELRDWQGRDQKRHDVQDVQGVVEIIELYQRQMALHTYRKSPDGTWTFESVGGAEAMLEIPSLGMAIPLAEIYEFATLDDDGE